MKINSVFQVMWCFYILNIKLLQNSSFMQNTAKLHWYTSSSSSSKTTWEYADWVMNVASQLRMRKLYGKNVSLSVLILLFVSGKEVVLLMQALNSLATPEEKLAALCKKYADLVRWIPVNLWTILWNTSFRHTHMLAVRTHLYISSKELIYKTIRCIKQNRYV